MCISFYFVILFSCSLIQEKGCQKTRRPAHLSADECKMDCKPTMDNEKDYLVRQSVFVDAAATDSAASSPRQCSGFLHKMKSARRFGGQSHHWMQHKTHISAVMHMMALSMVAENHSELYLKLLALAWPGSWVRRYFVLKYADDVKAASMTVSPCLCMCRHGCVQAKYFRSYLCRFAACVLSIEE